MGAVEHDLGCGIRQAFGGQLAHLNRRDVDGAGQVPGAVVRRRQDLDQGERITPVDIEEVVEESGAALVIRAGGGRAGESFSIAEERVSIGRSPDAGVFLDDVTVSRNHALLVRRRDGLYIDDLGSLNGTYVNRRRIESHRLADGDEIQVGKYKLSYLER